MPDLVIQEALGKGLRPNVNVPRNAPFLQDCMNVRIAQDGAHAYEPITNPFDPADLAAAGIVEAWPFPQLIRGNSVTLLCTATKIFEVNEADWSLTEIELYRAGEPFQERTSNGTFTGSATGWTLTNWSYSSNTITSTTAGATAVQARADQLFPLEAGHTYRVSIECVVNAGSVRVKLGDAAGQWRYFSGTHVEDITATGSTLAITIEAGTDFDGSVTAVSVKAVPPFECTTNGSFTGSADPWDLTGCAYLGNAIGGTGTGMSATLALAGQSSKVQAGKRYKVVYDVIVTAGGVRVKLGTAAGTTRTTTGTYTEYITAEFNGLVTFESTAPDTTFVLNSISIQERPLAVAGGLWHFSDSYTTWFLHNGNCTIFRVGTSATYMQNTQTVKTGCYHRGRMITGGFDSDFWGTDWKAQWDSWMHKAAPQFSSAQMGLAGNVVMWSSIGGGDVLSWLYPSLGICPPSGMQGYSSSQPIIEKYLQRNEMGFMPMPFQGDVLCVKGLGKGFVAYGEDGVCYLPMANNPYPTFGLVELLRGVGLQSRAAVGGDENGHVFLDTTGCLWRIGADATLTRLDYTEFFEPLLAETVVITKDAQKGDFFISTGTASFLLTDAGLSKIGESTSGQAYALGVRVGYPFDLGNDTCMVHTTPFNMGSGIVKTVQKVSVVGSNASTFTVVVQARMDEDSPFSDFSSPTTRDTGDVFPLVCGKEFCIKVTSAAFATTKIDSIHVTWDAQGKRALSWVLV